MPQSKQTAEPYYYIQIPGRGHFEKGDAWMFYGEGMVDLVFAIICFCGLISIPFGLILLHDAGVSFYTADLCRKCLTYEEWLEKHKNLEVNKETKRSIK